MIEQSVQRKWKNTMADVAGIFVVGSIIFLYFQWDSIGSPKWLLELLTGLNDWKTILLSILLEDIPFVILGVFLSSLIQLYISEQTIQRFIPRNPFFGVMIAALIGLVFPICECGIIPVVHRLMRKGMPLYLAVVLLISVPIINPIVFISTFMAFRSTPHIAFERLSFAYLIAVIIGLCVYFLFKQNPLHDAAQHGDHIPHEHDHAETEHRHGRDEHQKHDIRHTAHSKRRLKQMFLHASDEFFDMGKYLIFGSIISASLQTFVSREMLSSVGHHFIASNAAMMGLAYVLSVCSEADAFVASSFTQTFSMGSILTFLVFGPMLDMKITLMLLSAFRTSLVVKLMVLITVIVFAFSFIFPWFV